MSGVWHRRGSRRGSARRERQAENRQLARKHRRRHPSYVEPEPLISREELTATLFAINDIRDDVREIRKLLEEEGDDEAPEDDS
jgi:hypothetical protein